LVILSKNIYVYVCRIPKGFRDSVVSLYSSNVVDKKEILRTVSNTVFIVQVTKSVQFT
jgi:hypothetical protein